MTEPAPAPARGWRGALLAAFERLGLALAMAFLVVSVSKDRALPLAVVYYGASPPLVLLVGLVWIPLGFGRWRRARWAVLAAVVVASIRIVAVDVVWRGPSPDDDAAGARLRLVHWNAYRGKLQPELLAETLLADEPDVVLLSEPPDPVPLLWGDDMRAVGKGGARRIHEQGQMALLGATRDFVWVQPPEPAPGLRVFAVRLREPGDGVYLVAVDIKSNPLVHRGPPLSSVARWVEERRGDGLPIIVVGDLNTPRGSVHLRPLRRHLDLAYERAGGGDWPYTWPLPAPLIQVDHVLVSAGVRVVGHDLRSSRASDHRRQIVDLLIETER